MIPLLHDFSNATVLVFGGGPVGARKARRFSREADVVVVSPAFVADFDDLESAGPRSDGDDCHGSTDADAIGTVHRVRAAPDPDDIDGWLKRTDPALVVAATDDGQLNEAIVEAARDRDVLVNRADRSGGRDPGSVVVPATIRDDPVVVAVATGGTAPALSKHLRQELEESIDGAGEVARLCDTLRTELRSRNASPAQRREVVSRVASSSEVWTTLRSGDSNRQQVIEDVLGQGKERDDGMGGDRQ
ncbi:precorrin-2 dehydrogenase/sirohydrochlorin ferrochelatase family protein [Halobiforma nitratireducens]|uniref:precorrin-2 dehydrogenase n=1 Tax=Halobiforma nitratireducens JCM 10879 TaxID=1227454 RepID=M0L1M5_9EURY|nr:bifunctional precorrin-2 dehydrogenase/sirohydrochlorin ferrochelatase [Halobiforma nitratireducens]EMA27451.1 siroheme synthase [Halobiforma nitratireducens JCM 10879]